MTYRERKIDENINWIMFDEREKVWDANLVSRFSNSQMSSGADFNHYYSDMSINVESRECIVLKVIISVNVDLTYLWKYVISQRYIIMCKCCSLSKRLKDFDRLIYRQNFIAKNNKKMMSCVCSSHSKTVIFFFLTDAIECKSFTIDRFYVKLLSKISLQKYKKIHTFFSLQ